MSIEERAHAVGWQSAKAISGVSVEISRGAAVGIVTAVPSDTEVEQEEEGGLTVTLRVRDYLVGRLDFEAIVGAGEKPQRGDAIVETVASYDRTFEVIELGGETFRWWDKSGSVLRIHTVEVSKVTTTDEATSTSTTAGA